tara:strand:- start:482 stop:709 length:228 start_codon:yes stop_codon:yes gene_type:complete
MVLKRLKKFIIRRPKIVTLENEENIEVTDEIEKSLWEIKQRYDFDTEEISNVIEDYKSRKTKQVKSPENVDDKKQ